MAAGEPFCLSEQEGETPSSLMAFSSDLFFECHTCSTVFTPAHIFCRENVLRRGKNSANRLFCY